MTTEMTTERLTEIAADLNGELIAYRRITASLDDNRYAIAYSFGGGAWVVAVVDAKSGEYLDGTSQRGAMTTANINAALITAQDNAA